MFQKFKLITMQQQEDSQDPKNSTKQSKYFNQTKDFSVESTEENYFKDIDFEDI